jgi:alcohol dehydrogenase class IV
MTTADRLAARVTRTPEPRPLPGHPAAYFGAGCSAGLSAALDRLEARRVLLVHGRRSFARCGVAAAVAAGSAGREVRRFTGFGPNPELEQVLAGVAVARALRPDVVVGIGGGSAMDVAKMIAVLADQDPSRLGPDVDLGALLHRPRISRLVLMPTTAGSGAELTRFATVYQHGRKRSLDHPGVRADLVLVDPDLVASVPGGVAVASGLDALCQAVESSWAVRATDESRRLAGAALTALLPALGAVAAGAGCGDPDRREALALGAALAGAAIDLTRTTAAHALSYPLTAGLGLPHGVAVALHLGWLADHHALVGADDCRHPDGPQAVAATVAGLRAQVEAATGMPLPALLSRLLTRAGQPPEIGALRLRESDWAAPMAAELSSGRAGNSPRAVTPDDLRQHLFSSRQTLGKAGSTRGRVSSALHRSTVAHPGR